MAGQGCLPNGKAAGLSLVELLVAVAIQFILLGGMVYVYTNSKVMFDVNEQLSRVQENGRFATDALLYDIRMAGFAGCRSIEEVTPNIVANSPPTFGSLSDGIAVFENGSGWTNPTSLTRIANTDVIILQSSRGGGVPLATDMTADDSDIQIASNLDGLAANDLVLIFDCSNADLFRATAVTGENPVTITHTDTVNSDRRFSKPYEDDAQIMSFDAHTYFIATGASGEPGLYQYSLSSDMATLLAEGIESLQIILAEDTSGDQQPDTYVDATAVSDWESVIGIRVGLLVRSEDGLASEPRSFNFNGLEANSGDDRRVRKAFWSYAAMRNRIN